MPSGSNASRHARLVSEKRVTLLVNLHRGQKNRPHAVTAVEKKVQTLALR
jgi:hypothetical protein